GDELIVSEDLYGRTYRVFSEHEKKWNDRCRYVNTQSIKQIEQAITTETKAIFIETPTNTLKQVTDIAAVATQAKRNGLLLIV
ncbi:PLP-dependent transferase, partial [Bacillus cereus]|uniref:PLP-dependent transferase n=1 Tax=Bacillus cereus TaxID=1396 RepID=UPI0021127829